VTETTTYKPSESNTGFITASRFIR